MEAQPTFSFLRETTLSLPPSNTLPQLAEKCSQAHNRNGREQEMGRGGEATAAGSRNTTLGMSSTRPCVWKCYRWAGTRIELLHCGIIATIRYLGLLGATSKSIKQTLQRWLPERQPTILPLCCKLGTQSSFPGTCLGALMPVCSVLLKRKRSPDDGNITDQNDGEREREGGKEGGAEPTGKIWLHRMSLHSCFVLLCSGSAQGEFQMQDGSSRRSITVYLIVLYQRQLIGAELQTWNVLYLVSMQVHHAIIASQQMLQLIALSDQRFAMLPSRIPFDRMAA